MSKVKMRCTVCGKWFQSANAKEVTCPDCVQKARKEKLAAKNTPPPTQKPTEAANIKGASRSAVLPPKPKQQVQSGTNQWLDKLEDVKIGQPEPPPVRPKSSSPPVQREQHATTQGTSGNLDSTKSYTPHRGESERGPGGYRSGGGSGLASGFGQRPRMPQEGGSARGPRPAHAGEKGGRPPGGPRGKNKPRIPKEPAPPKPP